MAAITIRRLASADAESYRGLRLEGLERHPDSFAASWTDESARPLPWFAERLGSSIVLGGWLDGPNLMGVAGLRIPDAEKLRHKGTLWGMFVRGEARGTGLAVALVRHLIKEAEGLVEEVQLTVRATNESAVRLYSGLGFTQYGLEKRGLRVGDDYHDEIFMALNLRVPKPS